MKLTVIMLCLFLCLIYINALSHAKSGSDLWRNCLKFIDLSNYLHLPLVIIRNISVVGVIEENFMSFILALSGEFNKTFWCVVTSHIFSIAKPLLCIFTVVNRFQLINSFTLIKCYIWKKRNPTCRKISIHNRNCLLTCTFRKEN